jgi:hypothetical protein
LPPGAVYSFPGVTAFAVKSHPSQVNVQDVPVEAKTRIQIPSLRRHVIVLEEDQQGDVLAPVIERVPAG